MGLVYYYITMTSVDSVDSVVVCETSGSVDTDKYYTDAFNYETKSLDLFEKVYLCSNKQDNISELVNGMKEEDFYRIKTKNTRYPKTLLQFADGNASPNLFDMLCSKYPVEKTDLFYEEMNKQLLYNAIRGHKQAIIRIQMVLEEKFDINYTDNNGMNAIKLALLFNHKPKFIGFLLSFTDIEKSLDDQVYRYALNSSLITSNNDFYVQILQLLVNKKIPDCFLSEYFKKKQEIKVNVTESLYCKLEESLLIDGIEEYFEQCTHPMIMAKLWANKLQNKIKDYKEKRDRNQVVLAGCDGNRIAIVCCIHGYKKKDTHVKVFCCNDCPGHKLL